MSETVQTILVAAAVLGAVLYLFLRSRRKAACGKGDGCGCSGRKTL